MRGRQVIETLNILFDRALVEGLPVSDNGKHLLVDPALYISLADINNSGLTDEAKALLTTGFISSGGVMQLKFIRHQPAEESGGQMTMELSGRSSRIGAEVITQHGQDLEPTNLKFVPATKMLVLYGAKRGTFSLFQKFTDRPEAEQEQNALVLIALASKAIGLSE